MGSVSTGISHQTKENVLRNYSRIVQRIRKDSRRLKRLQANGRNQKRQHLLTNRLKRLWALINSMRKALIGTTMATGLLMASPVCYSQVLVEDPINISRIPFEGVRSGTVTYFDADGDGDEDVLITGSGSSGNIATLYENTSEGDDVTFAEVSDLPFEVVSEGAVALSDVDGDGDEDILITGRGVSTKGISRLYVNDSSNGEIAFSEVSGLPFEGVYRSSVAFSDVDRDGDADVLITGRYDRFSQPVTRLYENTTDDGMISFEEVVEVSFEGIYRSSIAFSDVDSDGDEDLLLTGRNNAMQAVSMLYENTVMNGEIGFSEVSGLSLEAVRNGSVAFSDVDKDGDEDLLITGFDSDDSGTSKLYENTTTGAIISFSELTELTIDDVYYSAVAFSDVDSDGDEDLLVTGSFSRFIRVSKLYENTTTSDGISFSEVSELPVEDVNNGAVAFSDVDGDGDQDLLITGTNGSSGLTQRVSRFYRNNTIGDMIDFSWESGFSLEGAYFSSIAFSDVDGDGDEDVLITGQSNNNRQAISRLYENTTNDGTIGFSEVSDLDFEDIDYGSIAFADIDRDGDDDLLITGSSNSGAISKLYENTTTGGVIGFTEVSGLSLEAISFGSAAFSDVDNDGDLDLLLVGGVPVLYENKTTAMGIDFQEVSGVSFDDVNFVAGTIAFSDVDEDGYEDVLITGTDFTETFSKLYKNISDGDVISFEEVSGLSLAGVYYSSVAFSDVDDDGDEDLVITGKSTNFSNQSISKLYENTTTGGLIQFSEVTEFSPEAVSFSSSAFSDVDGDGDEDLLITGRNSSFRTTATLYENATTADGITFAEVSGLELEGVSSSSVAFSDMDNDGDKDLLVTGRNSNDQNISKVYVNATINPPDFDDPVFISGTSVNIDENISVTETIYTAEATDAGTVTYSLGGTDAESFDLDEITGELTFKASPDFEMQSSYAITITATDDSSNSADLDVTITINNLDEDDPIFTSGSSVSIAENIPVTETIYTAEATDAGSVTFSLSGTDAESFDLNEITGELTFKASPDFEMQSSYEITITATDDSGNSADQDVTITINNLDEDDPVFTSVTSVNVDENIATAVTVYTAVATDEGTLTYSLGGENADSFDLDAETGILTFKASPDFETQSSYEVIVTATDDSGNSSSLTVSIMVTDIDEIAPVITSSASISVMENTAETVYTATADESVIFSLGNSLDEGLFTLTTDVLSFTNAPDFETPLDQDGDNEYLVEFTATDAAGNTSSQTVSITVLDEIESIPLSLDPENAVKIYPNPVKNLLHIVSEKPVRIELYGLSGQLLYTNDLPVNGVLDLSALESGKYILRVYKDEELILTEKIIRED